MGVAISDFPPLHCFSLPLLCGCMCTEPTWSLLDRLSRAFQLASGCQRPDMSATSSFPATLSLRGGVDRLLCYVYSNMLSATSIWRAVWRRWDIRAFYFFILPVVCLSLAACLCASSWLLCGTSLIVLPHLPLLCLLSSLSLPSACAKTYLTLSCPCSRNPLHFNPQAL